MTEKENMYQVAVELIDIFEDYSEKNNLQMNEEQKRYAIESKEASEDEIAYIYGDDY